MSVRTEGEQRRQAFPGVAIGMRGLIAALGGVVATGSAGCGGSAVGPLRPEVGTPDSWTEPSNDGPGAVDGSGVAAWSPACAAYTRAYCERRSACLPSSFRQTLGDQETCEARYGGANCETQMAAKGSVVTPDTLLACAASLSRQTCADRYTGVPKECAWLGTLPDQAACTYDLQCQSGWCNLASGTWCGSCASKISVGGRCPVALGAGCAAGSVCADSSCGSAVVDGGVCSGSVAWVCTSLGAPGSSCITTFQCAWGNACIGGICAPWRQTGEGCEGGYVCRLDKDEYCLGGQDAGGKVCSPVSYATVGEACNLVASPYCLASGRCKGSDGKPSPTGACAAPAQDGETCGSAEDCRYPALCIGRKCKTAADVAGSCK